MMYQQALQLYQQKGYKFIMAYTTINKPSDYFNTKLYTGNGATQSITGVKFQPDWLWLKEENMLIQSYVYLIVRGTFTKYFLQKTNGSNAEHNR